jgi:hypothetical protein
MFLPLIIAILLGLVNPANHNANCNGGGTVYVSSDDPNDPNDPENPGGEGGEDPGTDGPGGTGTGGGTGNNPPPKP